MILSHVKGGKSQEGRGERRELGLIPTMSKEEQKPRWLDSLGMSSPVTWTRKVQGRGEGGGHADQRILGEPGSQVHFDMLSVHLNHLSQAVRHNILLLLCVSCL